MTTMNFTSLLWPMLLSLPVLAIGFSNTQRRWQYAQLFMGTNVLIALVAWLQAVFIVQEPLASSLIHLTPLDTTVLLLISFIGLVVLRYAKNNLAGDPDDARFLKWFITTVLAVIITITTNHLVVFWLSWAAISISLHQLLMFYPDRTRAKVAAHKKFLFARFSEVLMAVTFVLLYLQHETLIISEILAEINMLSVLTQEHQIAAFLLAAVALIKCAQLPLHGWLIQVVEAPTPVSALLHAGIINLGGFLLLLFSPLFSQATAAQWLVLVVAGLSTAIAALVMTTRISIKVRLAWSTTAQMGLMLIECALGLYELALLHLLAHSCYKAYAFLSSGNAVNDYLRQSYARVTLPKRKHWLQAILLATLAVAIAAFVSGSSLPVAPWILIAMALTNLFAFRLQNAGKLSIAATVSTGLGLLTFYLLLKFAIPFVLPDLHPVYRVLADAWISLLFVAMMATYLYLQYRTRSQLSRKLFIALNAGFYLDEWATRTTLRLWPISLPSTTGKKLVQPTEVII